jgi:hypothetical protein
VRKGEHGTKVYFVKQLRVRAAEGKDDERLVPMLREYTVFNVAQCEGLPASIIDGKPARVRNPDTRDALADEFLAATRAVIREGAGEAYYAPRARLHQPSRIRCLSRRGSLLQRRLPRTRALCRVPDYVDICFYRAGRGGLRLD